MRPAAAAAARLGLPVRDHELLEQALIHSSYLHEHPDSARGHNERLEFLGDAAVNLAVSEALFARHPDDDEGLLSARRAAIVSTAGLARLAARIDLGELIRLGEGEDHRGGRRRPSILASTFEALVGALVLDLGYPAARDWLLDLASEALAAAAAPPSSLKSPKSRLQELTQRRSGVRPEYRVVGASGPDHERLFRVEVAVDDRVLGVGEGHSRRVAETAAASQALEQLQQRTGTGGPPAGDDGGNPAYPAPPSGDDPAGSSSGGEGAA